MPELSDQERQRRDNLNAIQAMGIEAFPAAEYCVTATAKEVKENFDTYEGQEVSMAGRIMSKRIMGKAAFANLKDSTGTIQIYVARDEISPGEDKSLYNDFFKRLLDIGDIVGIVGTPFKTKVGEVSIRVSSIRLLTKSLRPLPIVKEDAEGNKYDAFTDPELRYRMRYVDLIVNDNVKDIFYKRTKLFNAMRHFFNERGYIEVETPVLQSIPGGAAARPFVTHHNSLDIPLYMRIANELYLKRLIVGGYDGVYEFSKNFRNEGMDRTHNPEFTAMEIYIAYKDYNWMMDFTEQLLEYCAVEVNGETASQFGEHKIEWKAPYPRITMRDAIMEHTGFDISGKSEEEIRQAAMAMGIEVNDTMGKGKLIDEIFGEKCEAHYIQPTFITDYPVEMSPLTKIHRNDSELTERFELMVCGKEIANSYSELNDPIDQRQRFEDQVRLSEKGDDEAMYIDQDFLRALEYGMPPTAGLGIGMDRLTMFLTNQQSIQEVLFFPQMRPEKKAVELTAEEKAIYDLLRPDQAKPLNEVKEESELSNKKWDKATKSLRAKGLIRIENPGEGLLIERIS